MLRLFNRRKQNYFAVVDTMANERDKRLLDIWTQYHSVAICSSRMNLPVKVVQGILRYYGVKDGDMYC